VSVMCALDPNQTVELDTRSRLHDRPSGYYRVASAGPASFIRAAGSTMTPAGGHPLCHSQEEVVLAGGANASVQAYVAPDLDVWDQ